MKHLVKTFYDPEDTQPELPTKERQAELWLNEMAKAGFCFAGIGASPYISTAAGTAKPAIIRSFITLVVVKNETRPDEE